MRMRMAGDSLWPIPARQGAPQGRKRRTNRHTSTIAAPRGRAFNTNPQHTDSLGTWRTSWPAVHWRGATGGEPDP